MLTLIACGSSTTHPSPVDQSVDGGTTSSTSSSGSTTGGLPDGSTEGGKDGSSGGTDGSSGGGDSAPAPCNTLTAAGPIVQETGVPGAAPSATGGTIAVGKYELTEYDVYSNEGDGGVATTGNVHQHTIVADATTLKMIEIDGPAGNPGPGVTIAADYFVSGTAVSITESCPYAKQVSNLTFSATATELSLFLSPTIRAVYTLR